MCVRSPGFKMSRSFLVAVTSRANDAAPSVSCSERARRAPRRSMIDALSAQLAGSTLLPAELWCACLQHSTKWPLPPAAVGRVVWPHVSRYATAARWQRLSDAPEKQRELALQGYVRSWVKRTHPMFKQLETGDDAAHNGASSVALPEAAAMLLGDMELPAEVQCRLDEDVLQLGRACDWYTSELEEKLVAFARAACANAARWLAEAPLRIELAQWPAKKQHQLPIALLIATHCREHSQENPLENTEIDAIVHRLFSGKPDAPLIRRQILGLGLLVDQKRSHVMVGLPRMVLNTVRLRSLWASYAGWAVLADREA